MFYFNHGGHVFWGKGNYLKIFISNSTFFCAYTKSNYLNHFLFVVLWSQMYGVCVVICTLKTYYSSTCCVCFMLLLFIFIFNRFFSSSHIYLECRSVSCLKSSGSVWHSFLMQQVILSFIYCNICNAIIRTYSFKLKLNVYKMYAMFMDIFVTHGIINFIK